MVKIETSPAQLRLQIILPRTLTPKPHHSREKTPFSAEYGWKNVVTSVIFRKFPV
jgi:hypothetical protein